MTERTLNQRTLDQLLPTLSPALSASEEKDLRDVADFLNDRELYLVGHARDAEVLHVTFGDSERQLSYSIGDIVARAAQLGANGSFDWQADLQVQRN